MFKYIITLYVAYHRYALYCSVCFTAVSLLSVPLPLCLIIHPHLGGKRTGGEKGGGGGGEGVSERDRGDKLAISEEGVMKKDEETMRRGEREGGREGGERGGRETRGGGGGGEEERERETQREI